MDEGGDGSLKSATGGKVGKLREVVGAESSVVVSVAASA